MTVYLFDEHKKNRKVMGGLATEVCKVSETTQSILLATERSYKKKVNISGWIFNYKKRTTSRTAILQELISSTGNVSTLLMYIYESVPSLSKEEADWLLPEMISIREKTSEASALLGNINYINDSDLKKEHIRVVRLVNRIEARVRKRKNEGNE